MADETATMGETTRRSAAPRAAAAAPPPNPPEPPQPHAAAAAPPPSGPEEPRIVRPLIQGRIYLSHPANAPVGNGWMAVVEDRVPWEDVFHPIFFSNKAMEMRAGDRIEVLTDTGLYDIGLRVRQTYTEGYGNQPNRVRVYQLWHVEPPPLQRYFNEFDLQIKHLGPHKKWALVRGNDEIQSGFETQGDAERARRNTSASRNTPPRG